jgi:hypothetical protein
LTIILLTSLFIILTIVRFGIGIFEEFRIILGIISNIILFLIIPFIGIASVQNDANYFLITKLAVWLLLFFTIVLLFDFQLFWFSLIRRKAHISLISIGFIIGILLYYIITLINFLSIAFSTVRKLIILNYFIYSFSIFIPSFFISADTYKFNDRKHKFIHNKDNEKNPISYFLTIVIILIFIFLFIFFIIFVTVYNEGIQLNSQHNNTHEIKLITFNINNGYKKI